MTSTPIFTNNYVVESPREETKESIVPDMSKKRHTVCTMLQNSTVDITSPVSSSDSISPKSRRRSFGNFTPRAKELWKTIRTKLERTLSEDSIAPSPDMQRVRSMSIMSIGHEHTEDTNGYGRFRHAFPLHPKHETRQTWDYVLAVALLVMVFVSPLLMAFGNSMDHDMRSVLSGVDWMLDIIFILDMCMQFFTSFYTKDGELIVDRRQIATNYLKGWFLIDILSIFPFHEILKVEMTKSFRYLKTIRLLYLVRLLRLRRLQNVIHSFDGGTTAAKIGIYMGGMFMVSHVMACFWFFLAGLGEYNHETWIFEWDMENAPVSSKYALSWYWAIVTVTTVGYGDITPRSDEERVFSGLCSFIGSVGFAFLVGKMSAIATGAEEANIKFRSKMSGVHTFVRINRFPVHLRRRIREFYEEKRYRGDFFDEDEILQELPFDLRKEVSLYTNRDAIKRVPFFSSCEGDLLETLLLKFKSRHVTQGEFIIQVDDIGHELFILNKGEVSVLNREGAHVASLGEGSFFGEVALLSEAARRTCSIKAEKRCVLYCLTKDDLMNVCDKFPRFKREIELLANTRMNEWNSGSSETKEKVTSNSNRNSA